MALRQATIISMVMVLTVILNSNLAVCHKYYVGNHQQWTYEMSNWPNGKTFRAGDILVFRYDPDEHNVARVNASDYNSCTVSDQSKVYNSGHDHIKLKKGHNYFICGIPGHCSIGMKLVVQAN